MGLFFLPLLQYLQKAAKKEEGPFSSTLPLCYVKVTCISVLGVRRIVLFSLLDRFINLLGPLNS